MATLESEKPRAPSRSASFQRMLELEKRYKLERLQRSPPLPEVTIPSPPPLSPLSPTRPPLQARRREALFLEPDMPPPKSAQRNIAVLPLSIDIPSTRKPKDSERTPVQEAAYYQMSDEEVIDDIQTPKATGEVHTKTVTFLDDEDLTDQSSICQSPSWEGYGEKRKKKKEEAEQRRREREKTAKEAKAARKKLTTRLSKEPPAPESRPLINGRAASAPLLDNQHPLLRGQDRSVAMTFERHPEELKSDMSFLSSPKSPSFKVHQVTKDNSFIGGVKLEREREAVLKISSDVNTSSSRSSTSSRSPFDLAHQRQKPQLTATEDTTFLAAAQSKKSREHTPPPVSYPPTSSKSFALKGKSHHSRSRSGSLLSEAAKLLNPRGQDFKNTKALHELAASNGSQESIQTFQSAQDDRGRPADVSGYVSRVRSQSTERHINGLLEDLHLGQVPDIARTRSSSQQTRSTSSDTMLSSPHIYSMEQNSGQAESGEIPSLLSQEQIASPRGHDSNYSEPKAGPVSTNKHGLQPGKKSFKDAAKAALKASINPIPPYLRRAQTAPIASTATVATSDTTLEPQKSLKPPSSERIIGEHNASEITVRPTPLPQPGSTGTTETRGSASSSDSYNDSSIPPSPVTTPDTSRPQSRRGTQETALIDVTKGVIGRLVIDDDERALRMPYEAVTVNDQSSSNYSSRANSRPGSRDKSTSQNCPDSKGSIGVDHAFEESDPAEEDETSSDALQDNWARTALPLDLDAQSFMGSFTNFELSLPEAELGSPLASPDKEMKHAQAPERQEAKEAEEPGEHFHMHLPQRHPSLTKSFSDQDIAERIDTSFLPPLRHQALPLKSKARANHFGLSPIENEPRPKPQVRTISFDSSIPLSNTAAAYLQEARHAVSTSPRPSTGNATSPLPSVPQRSPAQPLRPALKSVSTNTSQSDTSGPKPIAKMFVECCSCKFYHDMPSRVYECMARPNEMVEDRKLGVSGAITTCVKCPWCSHNMSTSCCAGYAAVVYLREKLHGP